MRLLALSTLILLVVQVELVRAAQDTPLCARIDSVGDAELRSMAAGFAEGLEFAGFTARRVAHGYSSGEAGRGGSEVDPAAAREGALVVAQVVYRFAAVAERVGHESIAAEVRAACGNEPGLKAGVVFPKVLGKLTVEEDGVLGSRRALVPLE